MRILHYYPKDDHMIAGYVSMLVESMGLEAENVTASEETEAKEKLQTLHYDILHIHGCWRNSDSRILKVALRQGTRMVHSPYGQLEPWIVDENYWKEKLPKRLLYQRHIVESAYAVIIQGRMEEECMRKLGWNPRLEIIRNPMITHSISSVEMARRTYSVYRKVLDSNTIELMSDNTLKMFPLFIKAGITRDSRWITNELCAISDQEQWRHLLCYAHHEQIEDIVNRGIRILNYQAPDIDISKVACYMPDHYEPSKSIQDAIGLQFTSENERLLATFKHLRKLILRKRLTISHLCELDKELREHDVEEDHLCETLKEEHLFKMAGRVMQLMEELTGLNEGLMPLPPLNDRITKQMKRQIHQHLQL